MAIERERLSWKAWIILAILVYVCGFMVGCATMSGLGEDIHNVSEGYRAKSAQSYQAGK